MTTYLASVSTEALKQTLAGLKRSRDEGKLTREQIPANAQSINEIELELDHRQTQALIEADQKKPPAPSAEKPKRKRAKRGEGKPRPKSRPERWREACEEAGKAIAGIEAYIDQFEEHVATLRELQEEYESWKDNSPVQSGPTYDKLETVCDLEIEDVGTTLREAIDEARGKIEEIESADLPLGHGRD